MAIATKRNGQLRPAGQLRNPFLASGPRMIRHSWRRVLHTFAMPENEGTPPVEDSFAANLPVGCNEHPNC